MRAVISCAILSLAFLTCFSFNFAKSDILSVQNEIQATRLLLQHQVGEKIFDSYRSALVNRFNQPTLQNNGTSNSAKCFSDLKAISKNPAELFQYIDAAGKPRSGIARGNIAWLGSYSECLALSDAQYCVSSIGINYTALNISIDPIYWGACFPKSCSEVDIYIAMNLYILPEVKKFGVTLKYPGSLCPQGPTYSTGVKATIAFFGVLLLFCLIGTVIDLVIEERKELSVAKQLVHSIDGMPEPMETSSHPQEAIVGDEFLRKDHQNIENVTPVNSDDVPLLDSRNTTFSPPGVFNGSILSRILSALPLIMLTLWKIVCDILLCFSLTRNSQKIFNTNVPSTAITCINGIRVISISWVLLGHLFAMFLIGPSTDNKAGVVEDSQLFTIMPVINGYYSVDSFFFLSGLLVAYTCFRKLEKTESVFRFNWFLFYFHRFWRLTPTYMAVILISVNLKRFFAEGPLWFSQYEDKLCKEHWWTNLLYINNFHPKNLDDECVGVSWYLANDMQFFVFTPPLLILMYTLKWRGVIGPGTLLAASTASIAVIIGYWDLDPLISLKIAQPQTAEIKKKNYEWQEYVYIKPWCRAQPYLVGFMLGYYIYRSSQQYYNRRRRPVLFWLVTVVGWTLATALGMSLVYGPHKYIIEGAEEWSLIARIIYGMLERFLWALVLSWVVYACHLGGGGLVKRFLSAKFWIPLSRLTFNVYLIHIIVLVVMLVGGQGYIHYDFYNIAYYFISALVLSYAAAYILAVTVQLPCNNLEDMAIKYLRHRFK